VVSVGELAASGLSRDQIATRVEMGWLHPIYRGVYAVGHPAVPPEGRWLAAAKAVGADAALSHFAATCHWEFIKWDGRFPEVTVPRRGVRGCPGIRVHYSSVLERRDVTRHKGIPVTTPARTLVDLAAIASDKLLRTAMRRALAMHRTSIRQLVATRRRLGGRRGSARFDRALKDAVPTRSDLEDVLYDLIVDAGFVRPDVNRPLSLSGRRVIPDFRWREQRLVVEADSRRWHDNPIARADDAERQALLEAHGERIVRVTWAQAITEPKRAVACIEAAGAPLRARPTCLLPGR
jgi:very-short-patch-repair endonuclease